MGAQNNLVYLTFGTPSISINYERNIPTNRMVEFGLRAQYGIRGSILFADQNEYKTWIHSRGSGIIRWKKERIALELNSGLSYERLNSKDGSDPARMIKPYIGFRIMLFSKPLVYKFGFSNLELLNFNIGYQF